MELPWSATKAASTSRWRDAEEIEAHVRRLMAIHSAIKPRGFDTVGDRTRLHNQIDAALDEWLLLVPLARG